MVSSSRLSFAENIVCKPLRKKNMLCPRDVNHIVLSFEVANSSDCLQYCEVCGDGWLVD